jgi:hypothetical protein
MLGIAAVVLVLVEDRHLDACAIAKFWHSQEAHLQKPQQEHLSGTEVGSRCDWHSFMAHIGHHPSHFRGSLTIEARGERFRANFDAGLLHNDKVAVGVHLCRVPQLAARDDQLPVLYEAYRRK